MRPTLVGLVLLVAAGAGLNASSAAQPRRLDGVWGGDRARVSASAGEVEIQIDCLRARSDEAVVLDADGGFSIALRFVPMRGANLEGDEMREPAQVRGRVRRDELQLVVGPSGVEGAGTYRLKRGVTATVPNCRQRG